MLRCRKDIAAVASACNGLPFQAWTVFLGRHSGFQRVDDQVRRDIIQGAITYYMITETNNRTALENWKYFNLNLDAKQLSKIDWSKASPARDTAAISATDSTPTFTRFHFEVDEACDTYLDFAGWGKGCIFLNGFNLGRFWEIGPQKRLYVPAPLLRTGTNEVIIFETEGKTNSSIEFFAEHKLF